MTQDRPGRPEKKDFDVLLRRLLCRPDANLPPPFNLEVGNVFYADDGILGCVLKHKSVHTFRFGWRSSHDLNNDIRFFFLIVRQCGYASEWDFGIGAPTTEHV